MLFIKTGDFDKFCIRDIQGYFHRNKKRYWFNDPFVKRIILEIDKTHAIKDEYLESPVFGAIPPEKLSGGSKALILAYELESPDIFATKMGDNCVPLLLEISKMKDITITLHHCMRFPDDGFEAVFLDSNRKISTDKEFVDEYYRLRDMRRDKLNNKNAGSINAF